MKKFFIGALVFVLAIMLTGCSLTKNAKSVKNTIEKRIKTESKAELDCKQQVTESGLAVDIDFNVDFVNNIIKDIDFTYDMDLSSYNDQQVEAVSNTDLCTVVKDAMPTYKDAFTDCKQRVENKHILIESELDIDKIAKNELEKISKPEAAKKDLEEQVNLKCKEIKRDREERF